MKKINLIEWLWKTDSHEKQKPQRFARYAAILIMLLTLGVGQMWATVTIYAVGSMQDNGGKWHDEKTNLNCHNWGSSGTTWPGQAMTKWNDVSVDGHQVWKCNLKADANTNILFNNGSWQTDDKTINATQKAYPYPTYLNGDWVYSPRVAKCLWEGDMHAYGGRVYFDNSSANWSSTYMYLVIGHGSYVGYYRMTQLGNTKLYYVDLGSQSWGDAKYVAIVGNSSSKSTGSGNPNNLAALNKFSDVVNYSLDYESTYMVSMSSGTNCTPISIEYNSSGYSGYNYSQTVQKYTSTDGGSSYSKANINSGSVTITPYKLTNNGTVSNSSNTGTLDEASETSVSKDAVYTGEVALEASANTGFDFVGWFGAASGGSALSTETSYTYNAPKSTKTIYARFKKKQYTVSYGVNSSTRWGSITLNSGSAITTTSSSTLNHGTSISFTASPNTNYQVEGWYSDAACSAVNRLQSGGTSYDAGTLTAAKTVYVKFAEKTGGVLTINAGSNGQISKDNENWASSATYTGITTTSALNIYAKGNTGYHFDAWAKSSGSGTITNTGSASTTFTPVAYEDATITASFAETMSTLSTSCHYDAGNPSYAAPSVSGSATNVGYATTRTITATSAGTGYTFAGWTLTNCTRTDGGAATATQITIRSNGDGAAASVVANYNEDLTSRWHLVGQNVASKVTFPNGWTVNNTSMMQKATGHSTESVVYANVTVSNADGTYEFKIVDDNGASSDIWYGYSTGSTYLTWTATSTKNVYSGDGNSNNLKFTPTVAGTYVFKVDYSGTYPAVTITYPVSYTLTYGIGSVKGNDGNISTSPITASGSKVLEGSTVTLTAPAAKAGYTWKGWYTNAAGTSAQQCATAAYTVTMNADKTLYACYTEDMHDVTVNAQTGGTVSYNGGAASSSCTARAGIATASANIVATASTGYYFIGWSLPDGTITKASESTYNGATSTCTINATADSKTVTALFGVRYALLGSRDDAPTDTKAGMPGWGESNEAPFTYSEGTYTKTVDLTVPNEMYKFRIVDRRGASHTSYGLSSKAVVAADGSYHDLASTNADAQLATAGVGTYTLYVQTNGSGKPKVKIANPLSHLITMGTKTDYGTGGTISAVDGEATPNPISNGKYIKDGGSIVATASENTGYTFAGWFSDADCTIALNDDEDAVTLTYTRTNLKAAKSIYAKFTENRTTVNLVANPTGKGTFTSGGNTVTSVSAGVTTHPSVRAVPATGYRVNTSAIVWTKDNNYVTLSGDRVNPVTITGTGTVGNTTALTATFTPHTYQVSFSANGGSGDAMSNQNFTYDVAQNLTANTYTRTGYTFAGWATSADGAVAYSNGESVSNLTSENGATFPLYAVWTPKTTTITYNQSGTGYGTGGQSTTLTATYDAAMPTPITTPTAADGYAFMGYYDALDPLGTQYYTSAGESARTWDKEDAAVNLYAYFKKAEITGITFSPATVVAPNATVTVTPTIEPTPTGTTHVCWRVLYSNDNPLAEQPTFTPVSGNTVSFPASATSGSYKLEAVLHLGSGCGGTELSTYVANFQVAGDHEVTVQYKDAEGNTIQASGTVTGRPLAWSSKITAPEIFGYSFHHWAAGDGVTLSKDSSTEHAYDTAQVASIYIKAVYDGRLTAVYNQNQMIYFKNTLGWENVYVNFHTGNAWNNTDNGSGSPKGVGNSSLSEKNRNNHMIQIGESDVYYYDYGAESISPSLYISFTDQSRPSASEFWGDNPGINVSYPANYADAISTDRSSENGFKAATPMFVPLAGQDPVAKNVSSTGKANYYNSGYWTKYTEGTGYTLELYYDYDGSPIVQSVPFTSADELMPMQAVLDLEANSTYRYQVRRGGTESNGIYYGNTGTMTYASHGVGTGWIMENTMGGGFQKAKITANAAGNYTFNLSYSANKENQYRLRMEVDYPIADGDYRLIYTDATRDSGTRYKPSAIVTKANNSKDTVSFFIRPSSSPVLKIQQASVTSAGVITWGDLSDISSSVTSLPKDSVYNICLTMDGSGVPSVESVVGYTGNFYIRTNAVGGSKWDNYRSSDHLMTYSEYSEKNSDYSHYFMAHIYASNENKFNVKFVVANDYSPCISDTLKQSDYRGGDSYHVDGNGDISAEANIRFMWNKNTNAVIRAYLSAAKSDGSKFLVLRGTDSDNILDPSGNALSDATNNNHKGGDHCMQFVDNENWIYETNVKVVPSSYVKLYALFNTKEFYFKGENNNTFDEDNAIKLIEGSGDAQLVRVLYDFKTDRLVAAWLPSGEIEGNKEIHADVMFVREHQGDIAQITFKDGESKISEIKTAYAVLRFNKWTINNKSKADGHAPLDPLLSRYERDLFYVSFPFRVSMNEVFGFGKYGKHWIIEYYDGAARAENGFWADTPTYWRYVTDRRGKFFEPNQGYIIALDLDEMGEESDVWVNGVQNVELYFPSYGTMGNITNSTVTYELPEHTCSINRPTPKGDRRTADSHWNIMSVPTYVNTSSVEFANTTWTATLPNYLYEWNSTDNSLTPRSGSGYTYHAMHAYTVQYSGNVTWTSSTTVTPSSIVARRAYEDAPQDVEFRLELSQNEEAIDHAFVKLSNEEGVSSEFAFGEDMSKEFNKNKANIYTMVTTMMDDGPSITETAGNCLPMSEQTTVVPVGVKIATTGDYTFAIPDGTSGVGVTLVDLETGVRTNLALFGYDINLEAGDYNDRFMLEISPVQPISQGVEEVNGEGLEANGVRKVLIDNVLYIIRDGKVFDAQGKRLH